MPPLAGAIHVMNGDRQFDIAVRALRDAGRSDGVLSADATLSARIDELEARLDLLRSDVANGSIGASAAFRAQ